MSKTPKRWRKILPPPAGLKGNITVKQAQAAFENWANSSKNRLDAMKKSTKKATFGLAERKAVKKILEHITTDGAQITSSLIKEAERILRAL